MKDFHILTQEDRKKAKRVKMFTQNGQLKQNTALYKCRSLDHCTLVVRTEFNNANLDPLFNYQTCPFLGAVEHVMKTR